MRKQYRRELKKKTVVFLIIIDEDSIMPMSPEKNGFMPFPKENILRYILVRYIYIFLSIRLGITET